jgi:hypothetical protein
MLPSMLPSWPLALVLLLFNILAWLFTIAQVFACTEGLSSPCSVAPSSAPLGT